MQKMSSIAKSNPSSEFLFRVTGRMRGKYRYRVEDEHGRRVPLIDHRGQPVQYRGEWLPNLITNLGLDRMPLASIFAPAQSAAASGWRQYLAVGTGSTAPTFEDAALDSEAQRANTNGSTGADVNPVYTLDTVNDVFRCTQKRDVQVTMNADRNLTEWGLSDQSATGVNIRELFRDGEGNPTTISLLNGKILRLQHVLTTEIAAPAAGTPASLSIHEVDAANNPVGSTEYDVVAGFTGTVSSIFTVWNPRPVNNNIFAARLTSGAYNRVTMVPGTVSVGGPGTLTAESYIGESFEYIKRVTIPASTAEYLGTWNGIGFYTGITGGFAACFDNPATFTKVNTHTMRVGIVSEWARAEELS